MSGLIDLTGVSACCADEALELLHKAKADPPDHAGIWQPHHEPLLAELVETSSARMQAILSAILDQLRAVLAELEPVHKAMRLDLQAITQAAARLAGKSPRDYSVDDWMTLVDYLVARYLPPDAIRDEAEYLSVRAMIAGRIKAAAPMAVPGPQYQAVVPVTVSGAVRWVSFTPEQRMALDIATSRAAISVVQISDAVRTRLQRMLLDHIQARAAGDAKATVRMLEQRMFDEFSVLNRDWRRVAITEAGNVANEAVVASLAPGAKVKRLEAYQGACDFCARLNGMVFTVVPASKPDKDGWKEIWPGKSNVGRSASPRKMVDGELVERLPEEMWWPAAGVQHPNCRGSWLQVADESKMTDAQKVGRSIVDELLAKHGLTLPS